MSLAWRLRLHWLSFKSRFKPSTKKFKAEASEHTAQVTRLGDEIIEDQNLVLRAEGLDQLFNDRALLSVELQFLWGVFHEFERHFTHMPTNGYDRIKIDLLHRLVRVHGYSLEAARDEVNAVEDLYNQDDQIFSFIAGAGKETYQDRKPYRIAAILKTLHETGMREGAYRR